MPFGRMKVRLKEGNRHAGSRRRRSDPAGRHLCRSCRLERADLGPDTLVIDTRNAFEVAMGSFERRGRSRHPEFRPVQGICRAPPRSGKTPEDCDVLHRRHPLRKASGLSAGPRICRGLSPQGRYPQISGRRAGGTEPLARANVLCSTNGSRSAMACASAEPTVVPMVRRRAQRTRRRAGNAADVPGRNHRDAEPDHHRPVASRSMR